METYTIVMWYGTLATIPAGWQICDGTGGTPDLRGYFVKGAAAGNAGDNTAHGTTTHEHDISLHTGTAILPGTGTPVTKGNSHTHTTDIVNHEPLHKHLVFIMKL